MFGNGTVINSNEKKIFYFTYSCSFYIPYQNPIHILWNGSHLNFTKSCIQNIHIFFRTDRFIPEQSDHLIQQIHYFRVNLRIFLCTDMICAFFKKRSILHQLFLCMISGNKFIQCSGLLCNSSPTHCHKRSNLLCQIQAHFVHKLQKFNFTLLIFLFLSAARNRPGKQILPLLLAPDTKCAYIILQAICIFIPVICQTAAHKMENGFITVILRYNMQSTSDIFDKRIQSDVSGFINVHRNIKFLCCLCNHISIGIQTSADNSNIPIENIPGSPDQTADFNTGLSDFF